MGEFSWDTLSDTESVQRFAMLLEITQNKATLKKTTADITLQTLQQWF